jgi:hypothetical protein
LNPLSIFVLELLHIFIQAGQLLLNLFLHPTLKGLFHT